jgi:hypothetical protein
MSTADSTAVTSIDDLDTVVDSDFHVTESESDFLPYVEPPWTELLRKPLEKIERGQFLSPLYPKSGVLNLGRTTGRIPPESVKTPADVQAGIDDLGVDVPILTPGLNLSLGAVHHDELAVALADAYNKWFLDTFADAGFNGPAIVAPHRPREAAAAIDDVRGEDGIVGILLPTGGVSPPIGDERYHPIFEACERAGYPLMMHGTANGAFRTFPVQYQGLQRHLSLHFVAHPFEHMTHIASMMTAGVPELFPDLEFVIQEAGLGWIPYTIERLNHEYPSDPEDAPLLEMAPGKYIRRQFYFTSQPVEGTQNPDYVRSIVRMIDGGTNLMLSSDYPHYDFDDTSQLMELLRPEFDAQELRNIYGETAERVYGL